MTVRQTVTRASTPVPPPVRTRTRAIAPPPFEANPRAVIGGNSGVTKEMKGLAEEFFLANKVANAAKAKADKARKNLLQRMKTDHVETFEHSFKDAEGSRFIVDVAVETPETTYIDIEALRGLVKPETFEQIISATKTDVEKFAGTSVALQAEKTRPGTENVKIVARK